MRYKADNGIRSGSEAEVKVVNGLLAMGYQVFKRGWPDFAAVRGNEVRFIEVKRDGSTKIKPRQKDISEVLYRVCGKRTEMLRPKDVDVQKYREVLEKQDRKVLEQLRFPE